MCYFCLFFSSKCVFLCVCGMIEVVRSSSSSLVCIKWMSSLQVTGYWTNYVEHSVTGGLCSSVKPDFQLFHPSASFRVCVYAAGVNVLARGRFSVVNEHFRMRECMIFLSPCRCVTFRLQHFCFYSYHQCFQPPLFPSPLLQSTNSPFLPPAAVSLSQNHLLFWLAFFSRMAFLSYCSFFFIIAIIVKCIWRKPLCIIL